MGEDIIVVLEVPQRSRSRISDSRDKLLPVEDVALKNDVSGKKMTRTTKLLEDSSPLGSAALPGLFEVCASSTIEDTVREISVFLEELDGQSEASTRSVAGSMTVESLQELCTTILDEQVKSEYFIRIEKSKNKRVLGLQLGMLKKVKLGDWSSGGLQIEKLDHGLVYQWNLSNPSTQVCENDIIVEVNSVKGSSAELLQNMTNGPVLELRLLQAGNCETEADLGIPGWSAPLIL